MVLLSSNYEILKIGDKAPDFRLKGLERKPYALADFKGKKAVLVVFMCNHCPYVKPKMDELVRLQKVYDQKGLQIIGINPNDPGQHEEDNYENMHKVAKEKNFNFPYLVDGTQLIAKAYGAVCTPDPFLIDGNFKLAYHGRIDDAHGKTPDNAEKHELEEAIKQLLDGKKVTAKQEPSMGCSIKWKEKEQESAGPRVLPFVS